MQYNRYMPKTPTLDEQLPRPLWQGLILYQSDYQCEGLGPHRGRLHAHHIDEDKTNNSLRNGRCLCIACHTREHVGVSQEIIESMRRDRATGMSYAKIARRYGSTKENTMVFCGDSFSGPVEDLGSEEGIERLKADRAAGMTVSAVCQKYTIARSTYYNYMKKNSTLARPGGRPPG